MKSERVWKSNLGDFESSVSYALYRVCVSLSLVSFITRFTMMMMMMTAFCVVFMLVSPTKWERTVVVEEVL